MATVSVTLAAPRRRRPGERVGGRSAIPDIIYLKDIDNSRLCREVDPARRRECFRLLALAVLVLALGLLYAWQHFECVLYDYQIQQLRVSRSAAEQAGQQLQLERATLTDPRRIDVFAQGQLGLSVPDPSRVIRIAGADTAAAGEPVLAENHPLRGLRNAPPSREP